jgi:hypothetical protein
MAVGKKTVQRTSLAIALPNKLFFATRDGANPLDATVSQCAPTLPAGDHALIIDTLR